VAPLLAPAPSATEGAHARARQLLERYGVLTREAAVGEGAEGGFAGVYPVLKALEERGEVRRGYFVDGLGAAQFALAGAVDRLRASRLPADEVAPRHRRRAGTGNRQHAERPGEADPAGDAEWADEGDPADEDHPGDAADPALRAHPADAAEWADELDHDPDEAVDGGSEAVVLAATDPAQPYGAALPWPENAGRPARAAGAHVVLVQGLAVAYLERSGRSLLMFPAALDHPGWPAALRSLVRRRRLRRIELTRIDGAEAGSSPVADQLRAAGFVDGYRGLVLRG
jgi:ATP-dependent Lhr-like helicase